ncbi:MAG: hypothetical protein ACLRSD_02145 [Oscillibacter sp.]
MGKASPSAALPCLITMPFLANARSSAHALLILYYYDGNKLCTKMLR